MSATPQPEEEVQQPAAEGNDPNDFLIAMYGTNVTIRLNSGTVFKGTASATSLASKATEVYVR